MSHLDSGDLVRVQLYLRPLSPLWDEPAVGTVIDGPYYQEPNDPYELGTWSYKILLHGSVLHIYENHLELLDETVG